MGTSGGGSASGGGTLPVAAPGSVDLSLRHRPVLERGRRRFELILRSGREVLLRDGVDALSCVDVADHAGIPVGSVYQFFPNKYALVAELAEEDTVALESSLDRYGTNFPAEDWQRAVDGLIDHLASEWRDDPSRRAVWLAMQSTGPTRARAAQHSRRVTAHVAALLEPLTVGMSTTRRTTVAEVVVEMCHSLLHFSVHDGQPHPATVRELKRALRSYLRAVALGS